MTLVVPEDFPADRRPPRLAPGQRLVDYRDFVPAQNAYGGFVYAGGTMAFTAAYWALHAPAPAEHCRLGCDHGLSGAADPRISTAPAVADPLRADVTLRSLEAKSARLMILAARQGCAMVNLSQDESRLVFPRATPAELPLARPAPTTPLLAAAALRREAALGYMVASGRYWEEADSFDPAEIDRLDAMWLQAAADRARPAKSPA